MRAKDIITEPVVGVNFHLKLIFHFLDRNRLVANRK
jgi:hypothetical protein